MGPKPASASIAAVWSREEPVTARHVRQEPRYPRAHLVRLEFEVGHAATLSQLGLGQRAAQHGVVEHC